MDIAVHVQLLGKLDFQGISVPVSMGSVGALAPTVFESVSATNHGFRQLF